MFILYEYIAFLIFNHNLINWDSKSGLFKGDAFYINKNK